MEVYTIGFTQKSAAQFFGILRETGIRRLVDVRLHNVSQLAGFTRRDDLTFFLQELCGAEYIHELAFAPTKDMLDAYRKTKDWESYAISFNALIIQRQIEINYSADFFTTPTVLLCSEPLATHCHRHLVTDYLNARIPSLTVKHL